MKIILLIGKICCGKTTYASSLPGTMLISCDQLMQTMFPGGRGAAGTDRHPISCILHARSPAGFQFACTIDKPAPLCYTVVMHITGTE